MPDLPHLSVPELLELDRRHVWHPYGPMPGRAEPLVVESASGVRLRLADGIVMAVENSTFPAALIPDPQAIGDSLYSFLEQRGLGITRALQHFRAVNANEEIAQQMSIAPNEALLLITRVGYTAEQRAIELTDTYCRNDYYDFVAELRK